MKLHTHGKSRGQVLILSCVSLLILALMLMLSFNMSQAINEKIRLQNHADAQAYSSAVMEARALNTLAYVNRAIAASMVAQTALHAWMALASQVVATHQSLRTSFQIVAAIEFIICLSCCYPYCVSNCYHCRDAIQAWRISRKHGSEANKHGQDIKGLEGNFNKRVAGFTKGMKGLRLGELGTIAKVGMEVAAEGDMLGDLKTSNAPQAEYKITAGARSMFDLQCALEGTPSVGGGMCRNGSAQNKAQRSKYMHDSSNAARPEFQRDAKVPWLLLAHWDEIPMSNHLRQIQGSEGFHFFMYNLSARIEQGNSQNPGKSKELKNAGGFTSSQFALVQWRHGFGFGSNTARIISAGSNGSGSHTPGQAHSGQHKDMLACADEECFVNFRAKASENDDWGQPRTFGAVTQELRNLRDGSDKPYEINSSGEITIELVKGQQTKVRLVPQGTATAVAKGMVYYHQLKPRGGGGSGGWQHAPNLFDPFWRAKLHSFTRTELAATLALAGDTNGAAIAATGPTEGR